MKKNIKGTIVLSVTVLFLFASHLSYAQEQREKGVLVKLWEKWTSRGTENKASAPSEKKAEKRGAVSEKTAVTPSPEEKKKAAAPADVKKSVPAQVITPTEKKLAGEKALQLPAKKAVEGSVVPPKAAKKGPFKGGFSPRITPVVKGEASSETSEKKEDASGRTGETEGPPDREIPFTKEEMVDVIKKRLGTFSEIIYMIPKLTVEETPEGEKEYYYVPPETNMPVRLCDLDKEVLHRLFVKVNNEATILNTQRITRQIQQQQELTRSMQQQQQMIQNLQRASQPPVPPPQPPRAYTPPQPQQAPPQPPSPPRRQ